MNTGSAIAQFTVTLSLAVSEQVQVEWFTSDGTAKAGVDYATNKGVVVFAPGETSKTVDILVYGRAVGTEDRSFFVEMLPPTNAILGASIGECIIHVDTSGSTPVTQIIVPTGPKGEKGDPGQDGVSPDPAEIAQEVAPLIDVGDTTLTAEGTETLGHPDATTVKFVARRVAYAAAAKIATTILADGDNLLTQADLTGDTLNFTASGLIPRVLHAGAFSEPLWSIDADGKLLIKSAAAGDELYVTQYDFTSSSNPFARQQDFDALKSDFEGLSSWDDNKGDSMIAVKQPFDGAKERNQHDKNAESVSTDDSASLASIFISGGKKILCLPKAYAITSPFTIPAGVYLDMVPGFSITGAVVTNEGSPLKRAVYSAGVPYSVGSIVIDSNGNEFICTNPSHGDTPATTPAKWKAIKIKSALTLAVPGVFATINDAIAFIQCATITAAVTISCASHTSPAVVVKHPNGDKITIDGGGRSTTINFGTSEGIWVDGPYSLNISNITLTGSNWTSHGVWTKVTNAVFARAGGYIHCYNVYITKMYYGFQAGAGGFVYADSCEVNEAGDGGFFAFNGGKIEAINCSSHDVYDAGFQGAVLGYGFVAESSSSMYLRNCTSFGSVGGIFSNIGSAIFSADANLYNNGHGVLVQAGAVVEMSGGTNNGNISDNTYVSNATYTTFNTAHNASQQGCGIIATGGSTVRSQGATFNNNAQFGVVAALGSVVATTFSTTATGNASGSYSPAFSVVGNHNSIIADS